MYLHIRSHFYNAEKPNYGYLETRKDPRQKTEISTVYTTRTEKRIRHSAIRFYIQRRKIGARNDQIAELTTEVAGAAAPLCVAAANATLVEPLAALEADNELLVTLLLLGIF
jgi:hypothetical protein